MRRWSVLVLMAMGPLGGTAIADDADLRAKAEAFARSSVASAGIPLGDRDSIRVELVELNGSAPSEAFVYVEGPGWCGASGCQATVLDLSGPEAVSVGDYIATRLEAAPATTGGWSDITVNGHRHVFRGGRYGRP
jgi:hypothetical protein